MELVLLNDVENVGRRGDVVRVRDGFARNVLIPRKLALASTRANKKFVEEQKVRFEKRKVREKTDAEQKAKEMHHLKVVIEAKAGEQNKLFGSVTNEQICGALAAKGYELDKRRIYLADSIKTLGEFEVPVEIYPQVKTTIKVEVVSGK